MFRVKTTPLAAFAALFLLATQPVDHARAAGEAVFGFWLIQNQRAIVQIGPCGPKVCGNIVWLKPKDDDAERDGDDADDAPPRGDLCGLRLISNFRSSDPVTWSGGSIVNPKDGQSYSASLRLRDKDTLQLRGYVLVPLFGKTQTWTREPGDRGGC